MENLNLEAYSSKELNIIINEAMRILANKKDTKTFFIETNEFNTNYHKNAYLARIKFRGKEVVRNFISHSNKKWHKHKYTTSWTFDASEGDMFEARDCASYSHDRRSYYIVEKDEKGELELFSVDSLKSLEKENSKQNAKKLDVRTISKRNYRDGIVDLNQTLLWLEIELKICKEKGINGTGYIFYMGGGSMSKKIEVTPESTKTDLLAQIVDIARNDKRSVDIAYFDEKDRIKKFFFHGDPYKRFHSENLYDYSEAMENLVSEKTDETFDNCVCAISMSAEVEGCKMGKAIEVFYLDEGLKDEDEDREEFEE